MLDIFIKISLSEIYIPKILELRHFLERNSQAEMIHICWAMNAQLMGLPASG